MAQPIIIAVTGDKGGCGKSTTAINIADMQAAEGRKVLLVDLDPRGDCATSLCMEPEPGIESLLIKKLPPARIIRQYPLNHNLTILPSNATTMDALAYINSGIAGGRTSEFAIKELFLNAIGTYDVVVFDTSPTAGLLRSIAVRMASIVVLPIKPERLGLAELKDIIASLSSSQKAIVLPVMLRPIIVHSQMIQMMEEWWPDGTLARIKGETITVPMNKIPPEASAIGKTLRLYAPEDKTTEAYRDLTTIINAAYAGKGA